MKSVVKCILISFVCISCRNTESEQISNEIKHYNEEKVIITDAIKIDFLNEILSDSSNGYIYSYNHKKPYIRFKNYEFNPSLKDVTFIDSLGQSGTFLEYLSSWLKEKDTLFLNAQIENNKTFSINPMRKLGYNVLDWKSIYNDTIKINDGYLISQDSLETLSKDRFEKGEFELYGLLFNKEMNLAYIETYQFMSHGNSILYHKVDGKWKVKGTIHQFIH